MNADPSAKSSWERFKDSAEVLSKIATVVLTGVVAYATYAYNRQQDEARQAREREQTEARQAREREQAALQQVQTILGLFEPLSSSDPQKKRLAVLTVKELTNVPLALKLCIAAASQKECANTASGFEVGPLLSLSKAPAAKDADGKLQQTARAALDARQAAPAENVAPTATYVAQPKSGGPVVPRVTKTGWVFLGTYAEGKWVTRYLDFSPQATPDSLGGKTVQVRTPLNVRANLFYEPGYDRVVDVLRPGSKVMLEKISSYADAGYYIWAKASYTPREGS